MAAGLDFDPLIAKGVGATGDFASHQESVGPSALSMHRSNRCRRGKSALKGPNISAQGKRTRVKRASAPPWEPNPFGEESPERAKQYPAVPPFQGFGISVFVTQGGATLCPGLVYFSPYRGIEEQFSGLRHHNRICPTVSVELGPGASLLPLLEILPTLSGELGESPDIARGLTSYRVFQGCEDLPLEPNVNRIRPTASDQLWKIVVRTLVWKFHRQCRWNSLSP